MLAPLARPLSSLVLLALLIAAPHALADAPKVKPGKWETTVVTTLSIMPQPRTTTRTECRKEESFDPEKFLSDQADDCTVSNSSTTSSSFDFELTCKTDQGTATGTGSYRVNGSGDAITGQFDLELQGGQINMTISNEVKAKRIGDC